MNYRVSILHNRVFRLYTDTVYSREAASQILSALQRTIPDCVGRIEVEVPNAGWINEDEVETVQYLMRMRESE